MRFARHAPSTSLCAFEGSFAAGLLEAAAQALAESRTVLLVAYDLPYPAPLSSLWNVAMPFCVALVLGPRTGGGHREIAISLVDGRLEADWPQGLPSELRMNPAAASLPLLALLAKREPGRVVLPYHSNNAVVVAVAMKAGLPIAKLLPQAGAMVLLDEVFRTTSDGSRAVPTRIAILPIRSCTTERCRSGRASSTPRRRWPRISPCPLRFAAKRRTDCWAACATSCARCRASTTSPHRCSSRPSGSRTTPQARSTRFASRRRTIGRTLLHGRATVVQQRRARRMKRALVTGGSGDIGGAICRRLARDGWHVIVHANQNRERADELVQALAR